MTSSTPSPSISPAKSSLVMTSSTMWGAGSSACASAVGWGAASCVLALRPRRLGSLAAGCAFCAVCGVCSSVGDAVSGSSAETISIGSSGSVSTSGSGAGAAVSVFVSRGRRPRGAFSRTSARGASAVAFSCCCSAGTFSSEGAFPAIFAISSRFLIMMFLRPSALAISRNSARLFPSSAFRSCILLCCSM